VRLSFHPLTPDRWDDLESLFGERGATGGCWCMWWRLKRSDYECRKGASNRRAFKSIVTKGEEPGILAYHEGEPIGWCAIGPRETYPVLERSRVLKRVDDTPVWSITCFFVDRRYRKQGVTKALLQEACRHARRRGARIVEGYPVDPRSKEMPAVFAWTGFVSAFRRAGFAECVRRSESRPIMRIHVSGPPSRRRSTRHRRPAL
jgi:GNAT superfamily N-acetyltransferase